MTITYHNGVSIAEVVVYLTCLAIAIFLSVRHGLGRNAGWIFLIVFCLARIIGPCLQIATISQPKTVSLYTGSAILQNIGFSPLILAALGLLSRALESINMSKHTFLQPMMLQFVELVILVGLILSIVGGVNASDTYTKTGSYQSTSLNKAGTSLFIVSYIAIVIITVLMSFTISHAEEGEKRLLIAVAASLPFLLVRLVYSSISTFSHNKNFNPLTGNLTVLLCVVLIEEFVVVVLYEGVGLTLKKKPKVEHVEAQGYLMTHGDDHSDKSNGNRRAGAGNMAINIAKKTIIGRLVTSMIPSKSERDLGMERNRHA